MPLFEVTQSHVSAFRSGLNCLSDRGFLLVSFKALEQTHILKAYPSKMFKFNEFLRIFLSDRDFSRVFSTNLHILKAIAFKSVHIWCISRDFSQGILLGIFWCVSKFARDFFKTCQKIPSVFKKIPRDFFKPIGIF